MMNLPILLVLALLACGFAPVVVVLSDDSPQCDLHNLAPLIHPTTFFGPNTKPVENGCTCMAKKRKYSPPLEAPADFSQAANQDMAVFIIFPVKRVGKDFVENTRMMIQEIKDVYHVHLVGFADGDRPIRGSDEWRKADTSLPPDLHRHATYVYNEQIKRWAQDAFESAWLNCDQIPAYAWTKISASYKFIWIVEYDVRYTGSWKVLLTRFYEQATESEPKGPPHHINIGHRKKLKDYWPPWPWRVKTLNWDVPEDERLVGSNQFWGMSDQMFREMESSIRNRRRAASEEFAPTLAAHLKLKTVNIQPVNFAAYCPNNEAFCQEVAPLMKHREFNTTFDWGSKLPEPIWRIFVSEPR